MFQSNFYLRDYLWGLGGIFRERALGNALNIADISPVRDLGLSQSGTIRLYVSSGNPEHLDITQMHPTMTVEAPLSTTIQPVLETLADIYSPVKGLHFC